MQRAAYLLRSKIIKRHSIPTMTSIFMLHPPISYRRLLEIRRDAPGSLLSLATIEIVIDEVLPDTEIQVAD